MWPKRPVLLLIACPAACSGGEAGPTSKSASTRAPEQAREIVSPPALAIDGAASGLFEQNPGEWLSTGRTYSEQHYSPLDQITAANVTQLSVAWEADLASPRFGIEATPVTADGVRYVSSSGAACSPSTRRPGAGSGSTTPMWEKGTHPEVSPQNHAVLQRLIGDRSIFGLRRAEIWRFSMLASAVVRQWTFLM